MGRTKGSKNKVDKFAKPMVIKTDAAAKRMIEAMENPTPIVRKSNLKEELEAGKKLMEERYGPKAKEDKFKLKVDGVAPRKEAPNIPEVLVDGGMLYRFLLELRRDYDNLIVAGKDDSKESRKRAIQVIDVIMDYIMRMEKKQ
jgi:hypothetical protein